MKRLKLNYKVVIVSWALVLVGKGMQAQEYTDNFKLSKSFKVNASTTVEVINKYGKLHIITWDKDSVKFDLDATATSSSLSRAKKLRENMSFDFTGTEYYITAKSVFDSKYGGFFKDLADFAESFISSDNKVKIDYKIYIPDYVNLKLNNKYGDIYMEDMVGDVSINLSNGSLKANKFTGNTNIQISMGQGDIKSLKTAKINLNYYAELNIGKAEQLNLISKLSRIDIDEVNVIKISSKKDKIHLAKIHQLFGEADWSDIYVYNIDTKVNFKSKYGEINLESIQKEFKLVDISSEYTDINLFFQEKSVYDIDISHKSAYLKYPSDISDLEKEAVNEDETEFNTFGKIGVGDPTGKVRIRSNRGSIYIFHK